MSAIGLLLITRAREKVKKEQEKWEIKKVNKMTWVAVSPSGEVLNFEAGDRKEAEEFFLNKLMKDGGYGSIFSQDTHQEQAAP